MNKPPGLANYLKFNKNKKTEICYIFKLRAFADGSHETLFVRHLCPSRICTLCE